MSVEKGISEESYLKKLIKFSGLQWSFFTTWGVFVAFLVFYLGDLGFSNTQIGIMMAVSTLMGILGQPLLGYICDLKRTVKKVFIICMILLALIIVPFSYYQSMTVLLIVMGITGFLRIPQPSILDSWILESSPRLATNYGFMRAWGSIGFALMVFFFGRFIEQYGWNFLFISYGIFTVITVLIAFTVKDSYDGSLVPDARPSNIGLLFKNKEYVFLLLISLLILIPGQAIMIYLAVILKSLGGTAADQGYALFIIALSEAPVLFLSRYFVKRFDPLVLLLGTTVFYIIRMLLLLIAATPQFVIYLGIFQGMTFSIFLPTTRYYVNQIAPEGLKTTAQTVCSTVYFGVGGVIASLVGGMLIDNMGINFMLKVFSSTYVVAVVLLLLTLRKNMKEDKDTARVREQKTAHIFDLH